MLQFPKTLALLSLLLVVSCAKQQPAPQVPSPDSAKIGAGVAKEGPGRGVIKEIDPKHTSAVIDHNNIPGIMDAMAMNYKVDRPDLLEDVKVGDSIAFTLQDRGEGNFVVTTVTKIVK